MMFNDRRTIKNPAVAAAARAGSIKATSKPKREPSALSKKIGGMIMGTGSSNAKTVAANRAAIDAEIKPTGALNDPKYARPKAKPRPGKK